jgi:hypothetical protein
MQKSLFLLLYLEYFYQEHGASVEKVISIGASGLIHVLFSFIFLKESKPKPKTYVLITYSHIYGGLVWYVFQVPRL